MAETKLYVYWCPRCEVQTERPWHLCRRGPALIPQMDEETQCERIEVVPAAASAARAADDVRERLRVVAEQVLDDGYPFPRSHPWWADKAEELARDALALVGAAEETPE